MSFIDNIRKTTAQVGEITKKTFGPLEPLMEQYVPMTLRYPLDVGNMQRYPHTVEFQTWLPDQVAISDMGVVQAGQDKLTSGYNAVAGSKFVKGTVDLLNKGSSALGAGNVFNTPDQLEGYVDPYSADMMKVDRNQRWNSRMMDFTRRATRSDLIAMYLPQGTWNDRINNSYAQQSLTNAMGAVGGVVDVAGSIAKRLGEDKNGAASTAWDLVNGPAGMEVLGSVAGGLGMDGNVIRDAGLTALGYALNPQFEMLYGGTDLREFQFDFTMTPRSEKEAKMILNIIKKFKYHGSPAYVAGQGRYIVPPSYFDITFKFNGSDSEWLPQISTCVLKSFDVDYTGGLEQWATHADGSPIQVRMVMVFAELEMMHKSLRKKGY